MGWRVSPGHAPGAHSHASGGPDGDALLFVRSDRIEAADGPDGCGSGRVAIRHARIRDQALHFRDQYLVD